MRLRHGRRRPVPAAHPAAQERREHAAVPPLRPVLHLGAVAQQTPLHRSQSQRGGGGGEEGRGGGRGGRGQGEDPGLSPKAERSGSDAGGVSAVARGASTSP